MLLEKDGIRVNPQNPVDIAKLKKLGYQEVVALVAPVPDAEPDAVPDLTPEEANEAAIQEVNEADSGSRKSRKK